MENNNKMNGGILWDAVGVLTDGNFAPDDVAEVLELAYRTYAYNHIALEDTGVTSAKDATRVLNLLGILIDGARGAFVERYEAKRKEAKK